MRSKQTAVQILVSLIVTQVCWSIGHFFLLHRHFLSSSIQRSLLDICDLPKPLRCCFPWKDFFFGFSLTCSAIRSFITSLVLFPLKISKFWGCFLWHFTKPNFFKSACRCTTVSVCQTLNLLSIFIDKDELSCW